MENKLITSIVASSPDPETAFPWFEYELDTARRQIRFTRANGLSAFLHKHDVQEMENAFLHRWIQLNVDPKHKNEVHTLIVTVEGEILFVPEHLQPFFSYAHILWYHPKQKEWHQIQFAEK